MTSLVVFVASKNFSGALFYTCQAASNLGKPSHTVQEIFEGAKIFCLEGKATEGKQQFG